MHPRERAIKESRLYKATRDNLMGVAGKIGQIAKWLGTPVIRQGSGLVDTFYLDDPFKLPDPEEIKMADDDFHSIEGWMFQGLSRGMHLEIKYLFVDKSLTVDYKGFRVYTETAGELESYAPFPEWETLIERLYSQVKERKKSLEIVVKAEEEKSTLEKAKNFVQMLRFKWGI